MGQKILSTRPDQPVSGASLMRESVAGRKTQFVLQSTSISTSFTLGAGSTQWLSVGANLWATDMPLTARNASNIISPDETIIFPQCDAYVDVLDGNHYMGSGGLTSAQLGVTLSSFNARTPPFYSGTTYESGEVVFSFHNYDVSSHVVYFFTNVKYIVFADVNL